MRNVISMAIGSVCITIASLIVPPVYSQTAPAPPGSTSVIVIPERTEVFLAVDQEMKSGATKEGEEVHLSVSRDITDAESHVLIKAGWPAFGIVTQSKKRGLFGQPGKLAFTCDYILAPGGTKILLRSKPISEYGRDNRGASVAVAILLTPLSLFISGRDVTIKKGNLYQMYVDKTVTLTPKITRPEKNLFLTKSGKNYIGVLVSISGDEMIVKTESGEQKLAASELSEIQPVKETTGAPPTKNLFLTKTDKAFVAVLLSFHEGAFTIVTEDGEMTIKADDLKSVQAVK